MKAGRRIEVCRKPHSTELGGDCLDVLKKKYLLTFKQLFYLGFLCQHYGLEHTLKTRDWLAPLRFFLVTLTSTDKSFQNPPCDVYAIGVVSSNYRQHCGENGLGLPQVFSAKISVLPSLPTLLAHRRPTDSSGRLAAGS